MFKELVKINAKPKAFEFNTIEKLWNDPHIARQMLKYHLDESVDLSSRNQGFIDESVAWLAKRFAVGKASSVCDFGCGPELYAMRLAKLGAQVTGIDISENSIRYARESAIGQGLEIKYINADYLSETPEGRFDLILLIFCDYCALSPLDRGRLLAGFGRMLKPGGSVVMDVLSLRYFESMKEKRVYEYAAANGFWSPKAHFIFKNVFKYQEEKVVLDKYVILEESRARSIYNWLQCFSLQGLKEELAANGLKVAGHYGNVAGSRFDPSAKEFAVVAQRA